ncbi:MAG: HAD family hydrolase [Candidatus Bathyarchaeia archaeon]
MIKLLIFDAGGVLYEWSDEIVKTALEKFLNKHGVYDLERSDRVWSEVEKLGVVGKISLREAHLRWLEGVGLPRGLVNEWGRVYRKEIWAKFRRTPGINRLLRNLKSRYSLVVLSDTIEARQEEIRKMKIVGVDPASFDGIFTSHDLGVCKPSKKAFWAVLNRFDAKPEETLFISDACDELGGAKRMGLATAGYRCDCRFRNVKKLSDIVKLSQVDESGKCNLVA